ncbi:putative cYSTEINE SYNTHASE A CYSK2 [Mycobacterium xenopi 3993]|nr:putative cYSTEINE SYNTHASE A CYSK2 [Mycobacterium xenopi 3993]
MGLALAGMVYRHPVTLVTDPGMEPIIQHMLAAYGAQVDVVTEPHPAGGWQQARKDRVAELLAAEPDAWCPNQYNNPDNVDAYRPWPTSCSTNSATSMCWCARWAPAGIRPGWPGAAPSQPRSAADRGGHHRLDHLRTTRRLPADARAGIQHLPAQRRLRRLRRSALGGAAEAVWASRTLAATYYTSGGWSVARWPWWLAGPHAPTRAAPASPRCSRTARSVISTPSTTTTTAATTGCSTSRRPPTPTRSAHPPRPSSTAGLAAPRSSTPPR